MFIEELRTANGYLASDAAMTGLRSVRCADVMNEHSETLPIGSGTYLDALPILSSVIKCLITGMRRSSEYMYKEVAGWT